ncbi:MAG: hypothetical protein ACYCZF_07775 [Anaerolineae bacterium]
MNHIRSVESHLAIKSTNPAPASVRDTQAGRGGYETWVANTSKLSARTPELVVAKTREMVEGLFGSSA